MIVNRGGRCRRDRRRFRTAHRSVLHRSWIRLPGRGFELHGSSAVPNDLQPQPNEPSDDGKDRPEPRAVQPTVRQRIGNRRQQRRTERTARAAEKQRSGQAPAAEREFWDD